MEKDDLNIIDQVTELYRSARGESTMSKLERHAMAAMQGMSANPAYEYETFMGLACDSYDIAEVMIAEGERRKK